MSRYNDKKAISIEVRDYVYSKFKDYELRGSGVYGIRNNVTNQIYIGSTGTTFKQRWSQHIYDLVSQRHANGYLLDSWNTHKYSDFEFIILKKANETDSRDDIFISEESYINMYLDNNIKIFNIVMNDKLSILQSDYAKKYARDTKNSLPTMIIKKFKKLFINTFYDSMVNEVILEKIIDNTNMNAEMIALNIDGITENEYDGIRYFLYRADETQYDDVNWEYDNFDMCECNRIKCMYYDGINHFCRKFDTDLTEKWTRPSCDMYYSCASDDDYFYDLENKIY